MIAIKTRTLALATLAAILGGVGISMAAGWWKTTSTKEPVRFATGEFAGAANPADLRGSYTWQDIEAAFGVPAGLAADAFSTAALALEPDGKINALEAAYEGTVTDGREIGTDSVRLFVALYLGLPYEPEEGTALPDAAIESLLSRPGADPAALAPYALDPDAIRTESPPAPAATASAATIASPPVAQTASGSAAQVAPAASVAASADESHESPAWTITGKTTFGELYLWGLTKAAVEDAIGFEPGPVSQSVRDAVAAAGASFADIKTALQALLDKVER